MSADHSNKDIVEPILATTAEAVQTLSTPLVCAILVAATSQFLVGYNTGVMNAPAKVVLPHAHSKWMWSLAVAAFAMGAPLGAIVAGKHADAAGRRVALIWCTFAFLVGGLAQTVAATMTVMIASRLAIGCASGASSVVVPVYLGELAPPALRGRLGTLTQLALVTGILVADVLAFPFATEQRWRLLFAVTPVVAMAQLLVSPVLLESPRWLLGRDAHSLEARSIIKSLRGLRHEQEMEFEVGQYLMGGASQRQEHGSIVETLMEMWNVPKIRKLLITSLVLQMSQQFSGINAVFYYSTSFFQGVIKNPLVGTTIVGAVNVLATYAVLFLMDRCGRRTLILWSSGGMFVSCVVIVMSLLGYFGNGVALLAVNAYVIFFEFGLGPIPWLIVAEMFNGKYVATAMSVSSQLNWACNFMVGLGFPSMNAYLGPYSFGPFAVVLLACFLFAWFILPETQGTAQSRDEMTRTLNETIEHEPNDTEIDREWRKAMVQLQREEEQERQRGTYEYGFRPIEDSAPA
jgi:SP family facilitated glucose transporter-like MFS transporter 3